MPTELHPEGEFFYWGYGVLPDEREFVPPQDHSLPSERFTGLYSKTGVKIYEGDVVANSTRKPRLLRTIEWTEGREPGGAPCWTGWDMDQNEASGWIVVGNIHETPDLVN